jgi:hypothetical protein
MLGRSAAGLPGGNSPLSDTSVSPCISPWGSVSLTACLPKVVQPSSRPAFGVAESPLFTAHTVIFVALVANVAHRRFFPVGEELEHNPKKEKNAHRQKNHNKQMFYHNVYLSESIALLFVPGAVRSPRADPIVLNWKSYPAAISLPGIAR